MILGTIGAIAGGGIVPALGIIIGKVTDAFNPNSSPSEVFNSMSDVAVFIMILAAVQWLACYLYFGFW